MDSIRNDMQAILNGDKDVLAHYGMPRRSGRYPWGSGKDPYQHSRDFLGRVEELRARDYKFTDPKTGKTYSGDTAIAKRLRMSTTQFRTELSLAKNERRAYRLATAEALRKDGLNDSEIGRKMGINESSVRSLFDEASKDRMTKAKETADILKKAVDEKGMIDIGVGVERELGISHEKLQAAVYLAEREGYVVVGGRVPQPTNPGQMTTVNALAPPGTEKRVFFDAVKEGKIHSLHEYTSDDGGQTFRQTQYPQSIDSKRVKVLLKDEVGIDGETGNMKDGLIQIRRGMDDLSLGDSRYCQVRILVDGNKYLKGMAVYSDNMPDGYDIVFNSNKSKAEDAYKKIKDDPDNPFGALIKADGQYEYTGADGKKHLGAINKTREEGDWTEWSNSLPSQFLSKQSKTLAQKQLNLAVADKQAEFEEIMSLTNPTVKKYYLNKFADECDSTAVNLKAAALPGQKYHVIIPINTLKDTEVYAPGYENGTKLALIRYPHGGTFEIPILTVNNKNPTARNVLGTDSIDSVGINKKVADRLSGADYDGDTVMCIPTHDKNGKVRISNRDPLPGLKDFDPKDTYGGEKRIGADGKEHYYRNGKEYKIMGNTGIQMGVITNLITDMTLAGANDSELAAAVRHSMVVIDAEKHKLDYRQSEKDNNIAALHRKYQGKETGGAATIISRAKSEYDVPKRKGQASIDPETGKLLWKTDPDATYTKTKVDRKTGEVITETRTKTQKSTKMAETDDAYTLVSDSRHQMELLYADYANSMKDMARTARKAQLNAGKVAYSPSAKQKYAPEVKDLNDKLNNALLNAPRERQALLRAHAEVESKIASYMETHPGATRKEASRAIDTKKAGTKAVSRSRAEVGSVSRRDRSIKITDREWEAIQAGAVSETTLWKILNNSDPATLRQMAMPKSSSSPSTAQVARIKALAASNYTLDEIATKMGYSSSTISKILKGA